MPTTIIYDKATGAVLAINPKTDEDGQPILPLDVDAASVVLSDAEAAKFSTKNARFKLASDGTVAVETVAPQADPVVAQRQADWTAIQADAGFRSFGLAARQGFARLVGMPEPKS